MPIFIVATIVSGYFIYRYLSRTSTTERAFAYLSNAAQRSNLTIQAGEQCGRGPFIMPTNGVIRYLWDDSFGVGHRHQGLDIFGNQGLNVTPVVAAYPGYLTRLPDWKSTVIIRHPEDPLDPGRQIWTYYTHMADQNGNSFIVPDFPPGTMDVFVEAGTILGFQGNYSGNQVRPTGVHLHFSIVRDDGKGRFRNELDIRNTLDPSPYLGVPVNASEASEKKPECETAVDR